MSVHDQDAWPDLGEPEQPQKRETPDVKVRRTVGKKIAAGVGVVGVLALVIFRVTGAGGTGEETVVTTPVEATMQPVATTPTAVKSSASGISDADALKAAKKFAVVWRAKGSEEARAKTIHEAASWRVARAVAAIPVANVPTPKPDTAAVVDRAPELVQVSMETDSQTALFGVALDMEGRLVVIAVGAKA